jgi:SNF2 family DNA or RNA helicase
MLTGTPMPNYVRDLWAQLDVLTKGLAGKYWSFAQKYCDAKQAAYGWVDKGSSNTEELGRRLSFFALGRSKASVQLELPEKRREIMRVDVALVAATKADAKDALAKAKVVSGALRATAKAKRPAVVAQAVEAMQAGQKVIVFTYHREQAAAVAQAVKDNVDRGTILCVHGDLSPEGRDKQAEVFRDCSAPACFVATIDSVGVAISLVGADLMIFGDLLYEPWKLLQAEGRGHRHGSTCRLLVRYVVATGTIDEALAESVLAKLAVLEQALGAEPDAQGLSTMLGGNQKSTEEIVGSLFEKLKAWGAEQ